MAAANLFPSSSAPLGPGAVHSQGGSEPGFSISQRQPIYSARVNLDYRVLGLLENDRIYWFWIGAQTEYDELLQRL